MAKIANVELSNTFDTWRLRSNQSFNRLSQFAVDESKLYANTITANVRFVSLGATKLGSSAATTTIVNGILSANGRATIGTNLSVSGNASVTGILAASSRATVGTNLSVTGNTSTNKLTATSSLTSSGNTTLGDAGKTTTVTGLISHTGRQTISTNLDVTGNTSTNKLTVTSSLISSGNTTLGDAAADVITIGANTVTLNTNLNIDAGTLFINPTANRVGIGKTTPATALDVNGTVTATTAILTDIVEPVTISATAATGTINYDVLTQSVLFFTTNASGNFTVNFRGSSSTSLNSLLSTGQAITVAFLVTQGSTAFYNTTVQVDGSSVTPKFQGGTAPTSGNASSIDVYAYTIVKTASATFTIFASQTKFA